MHLTVYVLGKVEPVFKGDVTCIPGKGERVIVVDDTSHKETTHLVESVCWSFEGGSMSAFVYLSPRA